MCLIRLEINILYFCRNFHSGFVSADLISSACFILSCFAECGGANEQRDCGPKGPLPLCLIFIWTHQLKSPSRGDAGSNPKRHSEGERDRETKRHNERSHCSAEVSTPLKNYLKSSISQNCPYPSPQGKERSLDSYCHYNPYSCYQRPHTSHSVSFSHGKDNIKKENDLL